MYRSNSHYMTLPMGRNMDRRDRCQHCLMKTQMCICALLKPLPVRLKLTVLMHHRESIQTTNTARMALKLIPDSQLFLRGLIGEQLKDESILSPHHTPLYLYPSEQATTLTPEFLESLTLPIQLIVPDGSWRQTRKFAKRETWLKEVPHIKLPDAQNTLFFLRRRVKKEGISTFEAIARALGVLESQDLQNKMEEIFKVMVEKTLKTRGKTLEHYQ